MSGFGNIKFSYTGTNIFGFKNQALWKLYREKAVGKAAYQLKLRVQDYFRKRMPAADRPLTSKIPGTQRTWAGKLIDVVRQGSTKTIGDISHSDVNILGTR